MSSRIAFANTVLNSNGTHNESSDTASQRTVVNDEVSIESTLHPLYLQNMDHPGLVLISKKLTGTDNFGPWKRSITIALSAKNKLGIVNGSYPRPVETSPLRAHWDRVNDMVISWIMNTVSDEISNGMDFVTSAQEFWNELHDQFSSVNGHRVYQVLKDLHALEQGDKSVEIYYHKLKNLWDEYTALESVAGCKCGCECGFIKLQEDREQRKRLLQFLMGLNDSFSTARGQILMMSPLPTIAQAFSLIKQDEKQKQGSYISLPFLGNVTEANARTGNLYQARPPTGQKTQGNKSSLKCTYCNKEGHTREFCFKIIGYPDKKKGKGKQTGSTGFRNLPQNVSSLNHADVLSSINSSGNLQTTGAVSEAGSSTLEQLQSQVSHMNQLMILMMNKKSNSPEDHIGSMAGPDTSESSSFW